MTRKPSSRKSAKKKKFIPPKRKRTKEIFNYDYAREIISPFVTFDVKKANHKRVKNYFDLITSTTGTIIKTYTQKGKQYKRPKTKKQKTLNKLFDTTRKNLETIAKIQHIPKTYAKNLKAIPVPVLNENAEIHISKSGKLKIKYSQTNSETLYEFNALELAENRAKYLKKFINDLPDGQYRIKTGKYFYRHTTNDKQTLKEKLSKWFEQYKNDRDDFLFGVSVVNYKYEKSQLKLFADHEKQNAKQKTKRTAVWKKIRKSKTI